MSQKQVTERQSGNAAFMKSIEWSMEKEIKILGLDAPQKIEADIPPPIRIIRVVDTSRANPWKPPELPAAPSSNGEVGPPKTA